MGKFCQVLLIIVITNSCFAQQKLILTRAYSTTASSKRVATISTTIDSLFINYTPAISSQFVNYKSAKPTRSAYQIIGQEQKDGYIIVYLKIPPLKFSQPHIPPVSIISFSILKDKLLVLKDDQSRYETLEAAKADMTAIRLKDKYFTTWHTESAFNIYNHYPDFNTAEKAVTQKITDEWIFEFNKSKINIQNTISTFDIYTFALDMWVKAMVNNHFNPVTTLPDIYNNLVKYHVLIPSIRLSNTKEVQLRLDSTYSNNVRIDMPVKN